MKIEGRRPISLTNSSVKMSMPAFPLIYLIIGIESEEGEEEDL